ncbi:hypothetical protein MTP99_005427 [Tenebrio molitor]|nr:hypothetical protein MTP99_005427 [Tenebrio molitor]
MELWSVAAVQDRPVPIESFVKSFKDGDDLCQLESRIPHLEKAFKEFEQYQDEIEQFEFEEDDNTREEVEIQYHNTVAKIKNLTSKVKSPREIYFYCYYGTLLFEENKSLTDGIYMAKWYELDEKSKKALIILMERSKKPMVVTASKLLNLTLATFTTEPQALEQSVPPSPQTTDR